MNKNKNNARKLCATVSWQRRRLLLGAVPPLQRAGLLCCRIVEDTPSRQGERQLWGQDPRTWPLVADMKPSIMLQVQAGGRSRAGRWKVSCRQMEQVNGSLDN
jgi:hypothetical protein